MSVTRLLATSFLVLLMSLGAQGCWFAAGAATGAAAAEAAEEDDDD